jgi:hypothetical protein
MGLCLFYALADKNSDFDAWLIELKTGVARLHETAAEFVELQNDRRPLYRTLRRLDAALSRHMVECYELRERVLGISNVMFKGRGIGTLLSQLKDNRRRPTARAQIRSAVGRSEAITTAVEIVEMLETDVRLRNAKTHSWHPQLLLDDGRWLYDPFEFWAEVKRTDRRRAAEHDLRRDLVELSRRYAHKCWSLLDELSKFKALCQEGHQLILLR